MAITDDFDAFLFDLDGVVTPTAEVHMRAWGVMFDEFLAELGPDSGADTSPYTDRDYFDYVDGKPRLDGVASFLASRGVELPLGDEHDPPEAQTINALGTRKNGAFNRVLATEGVQAYPGSLRLLESLRSRGVPMAIVSSSRNAPAVLEAAGVAHFFPVVMHGGLAAERGLPGKPARHVRGRGRRPGLRALGVCGPRGCDQRGRRRCRRRFRPGGGGRPRRR